MGAYEYTALNPRGAEKKGVLEGDSERQIRQQLREQNLTPLKVVEVSQREKKQQASGSVLRSRISVTALALVTRQLATLVRSGTPLADALATAGKQTDKPRLKSLLMAVRGHILEGHSLADGLAKFPHVFDNLYIATVRAGEQSGHLDLVLERLADYTENRQMMRQKVQLALLYPVVLTVMSIAVVSFLLAYVVPKLITVFENTGQQLPWLTRALISTSDFMRDYWPHMIIGIAAVIFLFLRMMRNHDFRYRVHSFLLKVPVVGSLLGGMETSRLARTLSILSASHVNLLEALQISAQVLSNLPMRETVEKATERVREGSSLAHALDEGGFFPPLIIQLINSGEASGELDQMLEHAADSQERELQTLIATLFGILEPLLILTMGGVVLVIVLAIMIPIIELNQMVG